MVQFIIGFVVGLVVIGIAAVLICKKRTGNTNTSVHSEQLEELSKLTGELAHEIKNPLSTIKVNLKLVSEDLSSQAGQQAERENPAFARAIRKIDVIQKEADRLEQILNSFLRYIDRAELRLADTDINELVGDMVDFYSPQAQSHSITIRQSLSSDQLVCKIDSDMLKQVILNLFLNAQQAMAGGGELMIRTAKDENFAQVQVSDTGGGIPADKLAEIFRPFYSSRPKGTGLGLPTANRIIESHHGSLAVDSELGKGTQFTIKLPLVVDGN